MITFYSIVYGHAEMIAMQRHSLRLVMDVPARYVVVNNHGPADVAIICERLGIEMIDVPGVREPNPSLSHAQALNYVWQNHAKGHVAFLDMDVFLNRAEWMPKLTPQKPIAGVEQIRDVAYPWPGLLFADTDLMPSHREMSFDVVLGVRDTGGRIADYLAKHGLDFERISQVNKPEDVAAMIGSQYDPAWRCEVLANSWLHYGNGSDWKGIGDTRHCAKRRWLHKFIGYQY